MGAERNWCARETCKVSLTSLTHPVLSCAYIIFMHLLHSYPPWMRCQSIERLHVPPPQYYVTGNHLYTWVERDSVEFLV